MPAEPVPPLTAIDLLDTFTRYCGDESIAQARIASADFVERESLARLNALYDLHLKLYGRRRP